MRAEIKSLHSPDIDNLRAYVPEDKDCFGFLLQIIVGPMNEKGEESFDIQIVTPSWLQKHHKPDDIIIGRHYLIVFRYDFNNISEFITHYVSKCTSDTWEGVAAKISRIGKWEFEDFHE